MGVMGERVGRWTFPISKVQGVLALPDGRVLLSRSYGDNNSSLHIWRTSQSFATEVLTGPAGFEDLTLSPEGWIWSASESGARYFQKRFSQNVTCGLNWSDLYPYVYALDPAEFIPDE